MFSCMFFLHILFNSHFIAVHARCINRNVIFPAPYSIARSAVFVNIHKTPRFPAVALLPLLFVQHVYAYMSGNPSVAFTRFLDLFQFFYFHQDNIIADLTNIFERDDIFFLSSENPTKTPWSRNDQMCNAAIFRIKLYIPHKSKFFAVADIDDFFFFKSKIRIAHIRNRKFLTVVYAYPFLFVTCLPAYVFLQSAQ